MDQSGKPFYKDDEIVCDRDGIPHYTGVQPHLMREYRRRVLFAYNNLEGEFPLSVDETWQKIGAMGSPVGWSSAPCASSVESVHWDGEPRIG